MGKQKMTPFSVAFGVLILLVVAFMVRSSLRQSEKIVLPAEPSESDNTGPAREETVRRVEVRPDTVQSVIEVLARPDVYSRTITIERYWNGGSGVSTVTSRAADGWMRLDISYAGGGQTRHTITGDGTTYVWYGSGWHYVSSAAALSQDAEQGILTYEDILALPTEWIAAADYRSLEDINCIYVETVPDESGYVDRYWVGVDTGLLVAAERTQDETVVYRMAALSVELGGVDVAAFTLPDGTVLYEPVMAAKETEENENG